MASKALKNYGTKGQDKKKTQRSELGRGELAPRGSVMMIKALDRITGWHTKSEFQVPLRSGGLKETPRIVAGTTKGYHPGVRENHK